MSLNPPPARRLERGLDGLWYVAGAPQVLIVLAVLLAVTVALAAVFPQLPTGLDTVSADRWLASAAAAYGGAGAFLRGVGVFNILKSAWMLVLLAILAFHLSLRAGGQIAHLLRRRFYRRAQACPPVPPALPYAAVRSAESVSEATAGFARALAEWEGRRSEPVTAAGPAEAQADAACLFAERRAWAAAGPLLTYAGALLVILGLLFNGVAGWHAADVALAPGETIAPARARGLAVTLSAAGEGIHQLTLAREDATAPLFVSAGAPARWGAIWIAQRDTGPALTVAARNEAGEPVSIQPLAQTQTSSPVAARPLTLRFEEGESELAFAAPAQGLTFRAVSYAALPERGIERPVFFVEGYRGDNPAPDFSNLVEDTAEVEWEGLTLSFRRDRYVVVDLAALPGLPLLLLGGLLALAGAVLALWLGNARNWIHVTLTPEGTVAAVRGAGPVLPQRTVARIARTGAEDVPPRWLRTATVILLLAGAGAIIALTAALTAGGMNFAAPTAQTWGYVARTVLAGIGLGAWLAVVVASAAFAFRSARARPAEHAPDFPQQGRGSDPGRLPAAAGYPFLTAALIAAVMWNVCTFAAAWRAAPPDLWLLVAWLLGAAYLHATSSWRPPGLPAWFGTLVAAAAWGAALLSALSAQALLVR